MKKGFLEPKELVELGQVFDALRADYHITDDTALLGLRSFLTEHALAGSSSEKLLALACARLRPAYVSARLAA